MKRLLFFFLVFSAAAQDPRAIFQAAATKMQEAGVLAQQGKFGPANELISAATAEIDRAIAMTPNNIELRARRGLMYGRFPAFLGKSETAAEDLRFASEHPEFGELPEDLRRQVTERLAATRDVRPDRFPHVPAETSPIVAVASITWPRQANDVMPQSMERIVRALDGYPGLLAKHLVSSVDHPGMYIVFTWWKDKQALNEWFYGELHQGWMRRRGTAMTNPDSVAPDEIPAQVAMEVLGGLPGGIQINGGFIPKTVFDRFRKSK